MAVLSGLVVHGRFVPPVGPVKHGSGYRQATPWKSWAAGTCPRNDRHDWPLCRVEPNGSHGASSSLPGTREPNACGFGVPARCVGARISVRLLVATVWAGTSRTSWCSRRTSRWSPLAEATPIGPTCSSRCGSCSTGLNPRRRPGQGRRALRPRARRARRAARRSRIRTPAPSRP